MSKEHKFGEEYNCGVIYSTCDECGDVENYEFRDGLSYKEAQDHIKALGWSSRQLHNEWYDFCCDDCRDHYVSMHRS